MLEQSVERAVVAREKTYAFEGDVIRLNEKDFASWKKRFQYIPDLVATLSVVDAYYAVNNPNVNWWMSAQVWLRKENEASMKKKQQASYGTDWW